MRSKPACVLAGLIGSMHCLLMFKDLVITEDADSLFFRGPELYLAAAFGADRQELWQTVYRGHQRICSFRG